MLLPCVALTLSPGGSTGPRSLPLLMLLMHRSCNYPQSLDGQYLRLFGSAIMLWIISGSTRTHDTASRCEPHTTSCWLVTPANVMITELCLCLWVSLCVGGCGCGCGCVPHTVAHGPVSYCYVGLKLEGRGDEPPPLRREYRTLVVGVERDFKLSVLVNPGFCHVEDGRVGGTRAFWRGCHDCRGSYDPFQVQISSLPQPLCGFLATIAHLRHTFLWPSQCKDAVVNVAPALPRQGSWDKCWASPDPTCAHSPPHILSSL